MVEDPIIIFLMNIIKIIKPHLTCHCHRIDRNPGKPQGELVE
jgi:hypothetical protein